MKRPLTAALLWLLAGCGSPAFLALPSSEGVLSWIVDPQGARPVLFNAEEAVELEVFDSASLVGLPVAANDLRVESRDLIVDEGRLLPQLASYRYTDGAWLESGNPTMRTPFSTADCEGRCFGYTECPDCSVVDHVQACTRCSDEPGIPTAPFLPSRACPPGWSARDEVTGHHVCSMPVPTGIERQCPDDERWSMGASACVAIAACTPPVLAPGTDAVFVDSAAPAGGDGSLQAPFQSVPVLRPGITVVFLPGMHEMSIAVAQPQVTLLGHGGCSTLTAPPAQDVVAASALGLRIDRLKLVGQGTGRCLVVASTGSATVSASQLRAADRVVEAAGHMVVRASRLVRDAECIGSCTPSFATLHLLGGATLDEVDVSGPVPLWIQFEDARLRDVRLAADSGYRGLYVQDVAEFSMERSAVLGFGGGLSVSSAGATSVDLTDVLFRVELGLGGGFFTGMSFTSGTGVGVVTMSRVDVQGDGGRSISMTRFDGKLSDFRSAGFHDAISTHSDAEGRSLSLTRAWLDFERAGIISSVTQTALEDVWIQGCLDCVDDEEPWPAICADDPGTQLNATRLHIVSPHAAAILADTFNIDDLTVPQAVAPTGEPVIGATRSGQGSQWDVLAAGVALSIGRSFSFRDLLIRPLPGEELTPLCLNEVATGIFERFDIQRSPGRPSITVLDFDSAASQLSRASFESGTLLRGRVIEEGMDCEQPIDGEPAVLPIFHQVFQR